MPEIFSRPAVAPSTAPSPSPSSSLRPKHRVRVLRVRIKDKHAGVLDEMARAVNLCWNYCNELSKCVAHPPTTAGCTKCLGAKPTRLVAGQATR